MMKSWKNINKKTYEKKTTTKRIGIKFDKKKNLILFLGDGKQLNKVFLGLVTFIKMDCELCKEILKINNGFEIHIIIPHPG